MAALNDIVTPSLTFEEILSDGSTLTNPAADGRRLFLGEDGLFHMKDSAGTVTDVGSAAAHIADTSAAHVASSIGFTPNGSIAATDVQAAIQEVRDEASGSGVTDATYLTTAAHAGLSAEVVVRAPATGGVVGYIVRKSANEVVNNSSTLQDDDHLLLALAASEVWRFECNLFYDSGTTPDIKFAFTFPAGATLYWVNYGDDATGTNSTGNAVITASAAVRHSFGNGVGSVRHMLIMGVIANDTTPGNLQLQWAQNTLNASDTTLRANSTLMAWKLA